MIIKWTDSFNVHVEDIDNQHQKLVGIVNNLAEKMAAGEGQKVLMEIINELVSYTKTHFETEERIMKLIKYPGLEQHQQEHQEFVAKASDFQLKFDRGQLGLTVEVMNFLCDWIRNHIKKSDQGYALYIQESGVRP